MNLKKSQKDFIIFQFSIFLNFGDTYIYKYQLKLNENFENEKYFRNFNFKIPLATQQAELIDEWNKVWNIYEFKFNKQQISEELENLIIPGNPIIEQADENFEYLILKHQVLVENDNDFSTSEIQINLKNVENDSDQIVIQQKKKSFLNFLQIEISFGQLDKLIENFIGNIQDKIQFLITKNREVEELLSEKNELCQYLEKYINKLQMERDQISADTNQLFDQMQLEYQRQEEEIKIQLIDKMKIQIPQFLNDIQQNSSKCCEQIFGIFQSYQNKINELWDCQVKQNFQVDDEVFLINKQQEFLEIQAQLQDFLQTLEVIEEKLQVCEFRKLELEEKLNDIQEKLNQQDNLLSEQDEKIKNQSINELQNQAKIETQNQEILELMSNLQKKEECLLQFQDEMINLQQELSDQQCIFQNMQEQSELLKEKDEIIIDLSQTIIDNLNSMNIQNLNETIETQIIKTKNVEEINQQLIAQNFQLKTQYENQTMSLREQLIIKTKLKQNENLRQQLEEQIKNQRQIISQLQNECQQLNQNLEQEKNSQQNQMQINDDLQNTVKYLSQQLEQKEHQYQKNSTQIFKLQKSIQELSQYFYSVIQQREEFNQQNINLEIKDEDNEN